MPQKIRTAVDAPASGTLTKQTMRFQAFDYVSKQTENDFRQLRCRIPVLLLLSFSVDRGWSTPLMQDFIDR